MEACTCSGAMPSLGIGSCSLIFGAMYSGFFQSRYDSDGNENFIDVPSSTLGQDLKDLINETDPLKRIYPLPFIDNPSMPTTTDPVYENGSDSRKYLVDGNTIKTFTIEFWKKNATFRMLENLKKYGCNEIVFHPIDVNGQVMGTKTSQESDVYKGLPISTDTFYAMLEQASATTTQKVKLTFDLEKTFDYADVYLLTPSDLGYPATDLKPLIQAKAVITDATISSTSLVANVYRGSDNATELKGKPIKGLLVANFSIVKVSSGTTVTPTAVTESPDGQYKLTFTALTAGDDYELQVNNATGYSVTSDTFVSV